VRVALILMVPLMARAASPFAGSAVCAECHRAEATHYRETAMAQALTPVAECEILRRHPSLRHEAGGYQYSIARQGDTSVMTVTGNGQTLTVSLLWAFGRGKAGQTYVFEREGAFYESRVSFYQALDGLDLTMGAVGGRITDIDDAAGRRMSDISARDCFGCHSTGGVSQGRLHLESLRPGVGCEACHGPAEKHLAALRAGNAVDAKMPELAGYTAEEMSNFCGRCHRTWAQIALDGPRGVNNVRFQPYRLANSKCYDASDSRIRCTACHDPHGPLVRTAAAYDSKCAACHSAAAHTKTCPVAKTNCVTCHMPATELPSSHTRFTDHQIRIVRANQPYPD
jgi:Cytochrome c554 and c-prime